MEFGDKIKQLRIKMNLTQEELASRCDLSKGFISQIEHNLTSPSIATLMDILESLGTNLKDFFNDTDNDKIVFNKEDIFLQENMTKGYSILWLIPSAQKNDMEPILLKIMPNGTSETYPPHEGEIFGYVLGGHVTLCIGNKQYKIKKGESFYYKANEPHFITNTSKLEATVIWVSSPPNF